MSVQEMEDFTSLMEGWGDGLMTLSDDLGSGVYSSVKDENQNTSTGIFEDVLEAPSIDPFAESWMEQTSLSQMLEELTGMAMETMPVPVAPVIEEKVEVAADVDCSVLTDFGLGQDEFELLQQLVEKATEMDSNSSYIPLSEQTTDNIPGESTIQVAPVISLDDSGIGSMDSFLDHTTTVDTADMDDNTLSQSSISDVESILSSSPSSPSSSISSSDCSTNSELYKLMTQPCHKRYSTPRSSPYSSPSTSNKKSKAKSVLTDSDSLESQFLSKKERKKLQNKNAAIRYRQKKKAEADDIKLEEDQLQDKNDKLQDKVDELQREIAYMKNLMTEVYKARGSVKLTKVTIAS
ncbi:hypothetical protein LOTGIDRAFT_228997 [Lottia gigantea]|uniref:BZIP domain-containing protein n=1 Tax=Lottia gigantea TaxID=225164 RepID=V3ZXF7_LOTGI|nr:hypothetical protein LOTGIDRAFT_228997 [Lottia gigantea]ESO89067.1 hypothetical protein LOTGIDRAFT_228997 [Lottia gigantea]